MELKWTNKALSGMAQLYEFLTLANPRAAVHTLQTLVSAPVGLLTNPRLGEKLEEFNPREVRRFRVGRYEIRYEIQQSMIFILRLWHTRDDQ